MDLTLNQKLNNIISNIDINNKPNLFLHVCCGPCSSAVFNRLNTYSNIYQYTNFSKYMDLICFQYLNQFPYLVSKK